MFNFAPVLAFVAAVAVSALPGVPTPATEPPFLFDHKLLTLGHPHVAHAAVVGHTDNGVTLRFFHLVPKVAHALGFGGEFASRGTGTVRHHDFLTVAPGETLLELVGVTNCATWHATLLTVDGPHGLVHKPFAWVKKVPVVLVPGLEGLVGFLFGHVPKGHFNALVTKGLPAHPLAHALLEVLA